MQDIPRASIKELAHKINLYKTPRFAFFLGAGASRQSGILTAGEMIRHFKEQIILQRGPEELKTEEEKAKWLSEQDWYRAEGSEYCKCFECFEPKESGRQRYIESIIEEHAPSFGYVVLANLMAQGYINTIITTNFDDLVYSACTTFTGIRPIVYAYGVMASEMRFTAQRPKILKLHGDYLYSALKNTGAELAAQDPNMIRQLRQVLSEYGLIVVGYGGGDKSVMQALSEMSERQDLYWCVHRGEKQLNKDVEELLREKGGYLVEIDGFDEMMNEVRRVVEFDVQKMLGSIEERRGQLIKHLRDFDLKYSEDILGDIVDAARSPTTEEIETQDISALDYFLRAHKAYEAKNVSEAATLYRKAIELAPEYAGAYNNLGVALRDLKRPEEAEAALRQCIELAPELGVAYYNLGNSLGDQRRHEEAETAYRKAIRLQPDYVWAHSALGAALNNQNRFEGAEAAYRKAIELDPRNAWSYNGLGITLRDLKRQDEAEAAYRKAIELDPGFVIAYENLVILLRLGGREKEALKVAENASLLDDKSFSHLLNLAALHKKLGHEAEARKYTDKAREVINPSEWYNLACLKSVSGDTDAAIENLKRAAQQPHFNLEWARRDPDLEWIRDDQRFKEIVGEAGA